jgi:hypothetical protein
VRCSPTCSIHACGAGLGALALLAAGALGNLADAWLRAGEHLSIGASTAVFAAVGLLGGSEARARHLLAEPRARRFAPVGAAVLLRRGGLRPAPPSEAGTVRLLSR